MPNGKEARDVSGSGESAYPWLPPRRIRSVRHVLKIIDEGELGEYLGKFAEWTLDGRKGMARIFGRESVGAASPDEVMLREWAQDASPEAMREAHWFSGNGEVLRQEPLPGRFTYSMPFSAALVFGKWFNALALALFGVFAAALACCYRKTRDAAKKLFIAATGLFILLMAACGYSAYFGFVPPMLHTCVPLVSYGGSVIVVVWIMAGIVVAFAREVGGKAG